MRRRRLSSLGASLLLHGLAAAIIVRLASAPRRQAQPSGQTRPSPVVFIVKPAPDPGLPGLNPVDATGDDLLTGRAGEASTIEIPGFSFDAAKITRRASVLFPFLTPGLSLERFGLSRRRDASDGFHDPFAPPPTDQLRATRRKPLALSGSAIQTLLDRSWSRRDRWDGFQQLIKLTDDCDPEVGQLPVLLHAYLAQNGLQPYVDTVIRDPRLWTQLGLAADHVEFVGFISRFAAEHPSTKATTELLFLLDKLVEANLDALVTLINTDPFQDLVRTRTVNAKAYEALVEIRRHYRAVLDRRHLDSAEAIRGYYDTVRLSILTALLRTTPHSYRASDARFLIGTIHWRAGNSTEALESWHGIAIDPTDNYVDAYSAILTAIREADESQRGVLDGKRISRILESEHGRWVSLSFDRLRQFGYKFDTF